MANEQLLISGIGYKIRKLIEINKAIYDENESLKQQVSELTEKVKELTKSLHEKENNAIKLSLASMLGYNIDVEKGKEKLSELIEEIDKCINVLSE